MSPKQTNWFLRKPDGSEYGPVTTSELQRWATQCRIVAGNGVSSDRENWLRVEDIPELEMDWMAHRPDGREYGPFNITATRELFEHDVLPEEAVLTHRTTGKSVTVLQVLNEEDSTTEPNTRTAKRQTKAAKAKQAKEEAAPEPPAEEDGDGVEATVEEQPEPSPSEPGNSEDADPPQSEQAVEAAPEEPEEEQDTPEIAELKGKLEKLQERLKSAQTDLRLARKELANANAESVEITSALEAERDEAVEALTALGSEMEELRGQHVTDSERLTQKLSKSEAQKTEFAEALTEAEARLEAIDSERSEAEQQALQSMAELRKQTAFMKKNNATLQSELEAAQAKAARRGRWLAMILGILALAGAALLLLPRGCVRPQAVAELHPADEQQNAPTPRQPTTSTPQPIPRESRPGPRDEQPTSTRTVQTPAPWPELLVEGVKTLPKNDVCAIRFSEGVFTRLATPSPAAVAQLIDIAKVLKPKLDRFQIIVEGHTDDRPMKPTAAYDGNYALGLARAEAIRELLITKTGLPGHAIRAVSAGEREPPYPNDSPANRVRNRTVVLKLVRK